MRYYEGNLITGSGNLPTNAGAKGIFDLKTQLSYQATEKWPLKLNQDPTADWVEFSQRFIESDTEMGNSNDYTGAYDVSDVQVPATFSGTARVYLAQKFTARPTTFYGDCAIACLQILPSADATGTQVDVSYVFAGNSNEGWNTNRTEVEHPGGFFGGMVLGYPESLATSAARTYTTAISTTDNEDRWSLASSTGSSNTGAAGGISNYFASNVLPAPGLGVVSQTGTQSYIYREASGGTAYSGLACRGPEHTFSGGEVIRIAHLMPGYSLSPMNPNDTLYVGVA